MYSSDIFADYQLSSTGELKEGLRRLNNTDELSIDLSSLISTEIERGSEETSAPIEELGFRVEMMSLSDTDIEFKLEFENPLSVSIGEMPDKLKLKFLEPELFVSRETGQTLDPDSEEISHTIPKQFPSEASYSLAVVAGSSV